MRLLLLFIASGSIAVLSACQSFPSSSTACENQYRDGALEFFYDKCLWSVDKTKGPDFDFWNIKSADGKIVANVYLGFAPDVAYRKRNFSPKSIWLGRYLLSEFLDDGGYEALLELPKDLYGRAMYVHVFSPTLNLDDLGRVKRLVRSVRMEE